MPTQYNIPPKTEHHCSPCEYHKLTGALHVRCGEGGYRRYSCMHPEAFDDLDKIHPDPEKEKLRQRMIGAMLKEGRDIGKTELQPDWCPLKSKQP
jgi:hypothetical protein